MHTQIIVHKIVN